MKKPLVSAEQIRAADQYMKTYRLHSHILRLSERQRRKGIGSAPWEDGLSRAELFCVRHFIMGLDNSDEKLFLYYHYVHGETVESCAELLGISRSSGFRLKRRALALAAVKLAESEAEETSEVRHA